MPMDGRLQTTWTVYHAGDRMAMKEMCCCCEILNFTLILILWLYFMLTSDIL